MLTTAERKQPPRRSARAIKRPHVAETEEKKPIASDASKKHKAAQSQQHERPKRKSRAAAEQAPPPKKRSKAPSEHYRLLKKRSLPLGRRGITLIDQVKEEFAHLLKSDESLVPSKELGVNAQRATMNQAWEDRFLDFLVFSKEYGHQHVPKMYTDNPALGRWVVKNRAWKKNKDRNLTPSRLQRLEAAGFIWDPKADPNFYMIQGENEKALDLWEEMFQELLEYKEERGDCMVPKSFAPNERLARWVSRQRRHYKAKQNNEYHTLTDDKEKRLLDTGFVFITRTTELLRQSALKQSEDKWDSYCKKLAAFKEEYGHCAVPRRWKQDKQLASWVMRQRIQMKNKEQGEHSYLTDERIEQLKKIGFVFGAIDRKNYPIDGFTRGTPRTSAFWTKASDSANEEETDDGEETDEVAETVGAPLAKRAKTGDNNRTTRTKTARTMKASISVKETPDNEEPDKAVVEPSAEHVSSRSTDASERMITRTRTTKASVSADEASAATINEKAVPEHVSSRSTDASERMITRTRTTKASVSADEAAVATITEKAVPKKTTRRTRTSDSAERVPDSNEPTESKVSLGGEELQRAVTAAVGKRGGPKTTAKDFATRVATRSSMTNTNEASKPKTTRVAKNPVPAGESSNEEDLDESGESLGDQTTERTIMAPPGSLGIIISNLSKSNGTLVSDVLTKSVLLDKVLPGDRIIAVDGEDVSLLTAAELSKIIASKKESEKKLTLVTPSDGGQDSLIKDKKKKMEDRKMDQDATREKTKAQESTGPKKGTQQAAAAVIATNAKTPTKKIKWVIYPGKSKVKS